MPEPSPTTRSKAIRNVVLEARTDVSEFAELERVSLEIVSGPERGKQIWLRPAEHLVVGRTDEADFVLRQDNEISGRHFAVHCERHQVQVQDLNSRNGTFLQGVRVSRSLLADGDRIRAGRTELCVHIQGGLSQSKVDDLRSPVVRQTLFTRKWPKPLPPLPRPCTFAAYPCRSGLWLYRGAQSVFQPGLLASRLARLSAPCLVFDPGRLDGVDLPLDSLPLWLSEPGGVPESFPPLVSAAVEDPMIERLVDDGWGRDAVICVYPQSDSEGLVDGLQQFAHRLAASPATRHIARLTPRALADHLANAEEEDVAHLCEQTGAIFLELHQGARWAAFSTRDFARALRWIGATVAPDWKR